MRHTGQTADRYRVDLKEVGESFPRMPFANYRIPPSRMPSTVYRMSLATKEETRHESWTVYGAAG